jgi:glycosyltransferase involved in cell wall biosynthesis
MRILTVSAHYPPNFTSGGTLAPQRLARALAQRGHQSSVYAGWLGDRPAASSWDETDETGLDVRWIATSPWIGWDDEHNWHNPAVTDDFRRHLARVRPELVHFHSLQSLGAGLLPAARADGARVVVTMHDFWWVCARQFLVDRQMQPCSLVVDCGVCACQVDEPWRRHRGGALAALLASADLVLAPSASAVAVLMANGVAPGRLEVDENGLPDDLVAALGGVRTPARADGADGADEVGGWPRPVRFLYAGGPDPMKGADVLVEAVARLGRDRPAGWSLRAYGLGPRLAETTAAAGASPWPADLPVEVLEPFAPDALDQVLAQADVLVLASVMRETHSLLTREALAAGLAVVCTDTLGPEEVVTDGENGLVVPAAEPVALAAALDRLVDDADLLARLRAGAGRPLETRSLDDQVAGLETRYAGLLEGASATSAVSISSGPPRSAGVPGTPDAGAGAPGPASAVGSVLFVTGIDGAPLRYRVRLPAEALATQGVTSRVLHYRDPDLLAAAARADVVVCYRVPATVGVLELIESCHGAGTAVAFDVDDLIFDPAIRDQIPALRLLPADEGALWMQGVARYRTTLEACDAFIGSTDLLVERAAELTGLPAHRFDNGVGIELARAADAAVRRARRPGPVRIGYFSGTTTHDDDWRFVEPAVAEVMERHPAVELWLGGHLPDTPALARFGPRVVRLPFQAWTALPGVLRDLDVNLAPLEPGAVFNEAKSAIKWLEAALCATPTLASPTTPFAQAITDGVDGLVAATPEAWVEALDRLVRDEGLRVRVGARARRNALLGWAPARQGARYREILDAVVAAGPVGERASTWTPVLLDEPPQVVTLEPYGDQDDGAGIPGRTGGPTLGATTALAERAARTTARLEDLARRGRTSLRTDGILRTVDKAVDKATTRAVAAVARRLGHDRPA